MERNIYYRRVSSRDKLTKKKHSTYQRNAILEIKGLKEKQQKLFTSFGPLKEHINWITKFWAFYALIPIISRFNTTFMVCLEGKELMLYLVE